MDTDDFYPKNLDDALQAIKQTVLANKISVRDFFDIWCAGITCAHILSPNRVGIAKRSTPEDAELTNLASSENTAGIAN